MADSPAETPSAPAAPGKSPLVVIMLGLNVALMAGVLACVVMLVRRPAAAQAAPMPAAAAPAAHPVEHEKKEAGGGPTIRLADFVVRLRNTDAERFARISFEIEVSDEKDKEAMTRRQPQVRDSFIAYLSDRSAEELRGSEGLARAKGDLLGRARETAPDAHIANLYIIDFVVQ